MFPFIQCLCFDKRRGVNLLKKVSIFFITIRVLLWPEISALGVFLNFDNECMRPLNTIVPPTPPPGNILVCSVNKSISEVLLESFLAYIKERLGMTIQK